MITSFNEIERDKGDGLYHTNSKFIVDVSRLAHYRSLQTNELSRMSCFHIPIKLIEISSFY